MFFCVYQETHASVNVHSSKGRADLIIDDDSRRIVCEIKFARENDNEEILLNKAYEQMKTREYGDTEPCPPIIIKLALVFNEKARKITLFKEC